MGILFFILLFIANPLSLMMVRGQVLEISTESAAYANGLEPSFVEAIRNQTVVAGRSASLQCVVENLGTYKVAWMHTDKHALLTLEDRVITRNHRYSITHNSMRTWWLHISDVEEQDRGQYMCQINTSPMKCQVGYLDVVVPPRILEANTSSDTEVREGRDVSLRCLAQGWPQPTIKWRREDDKNITLSVKKVPSFQGEYLNISKVSRTHMGAYLCIASNGVQAAVSKRIMLNVLFSPMIWIPNQLVGAPIGTDVVLECSLECYPRSVTFWNREGGIIILANNKYDTFQIDLGLYKVQMKLRIRNLQQEDYGAYTCVAKNSLGETEGTIRLYEITRQTTFPTTQGIQSTSAKNEGTYKTSSEKVIVGTWQHSLIKYSKDGRKQDSQTEVLAVENSINETPPDGKENSSEEKSRRSNGPSPPGSSRASRTVSPSLYFQAYWLLALVLLLRTNSPDLHR